MWITSISIPEERELDDGLEHIKLQKLGRVVVIAGKNGSGKTRLLSRIQYYASKRRLKAYMKVLEEKMTYTPNTYGDLDDIREELFITKKYYDYISFNHEYEHNNDSEVYSKKPLILEFIPKDIELIDCHSLTNEQMIDNARRIQNKKNLGSYWTKDTTLSYIQNLQNNFYNVTHQDLANRFDKSKTQDIKNKYNNLKKLIKQILNCELERSILGEATLFNKRISQANISNGQKILLQLCVLLNAQGGSIEDAILILDEPELHLHPAALIEIYDKLTSLNKNGQIWIATHSVPLLSHVDTSDIWYMSEGKIYYSGRKPENVLKGLLGNDEQINKLSDFLSLPAQFASIQYAAECLFNPGVSDPSIGDPQMKQILKIGKLEVGNNVSILDYGAGKGRLATTLYETLNTETIKVSDWLNYIAYDEYTANKELCINEIIKIYGNSNKKFFSDYSDLLTEYKERFNAIVMCNVLHEIDPSEWIGLFKKDGKITKLLKEDGFLLLVEDQLIPVGEKAYKNGFLVLTTLHLKELFAITSDEPFETHDQRGDKRLVAHIIPKSYLQRITHNTKIAALKSIREHASSNIKKLREEEPSYKNGRLHNFYVQQLANSVLAIDELEG